MTLELNANGVPQYPKGHIGRLLVVLASIDALERPTASTVARHTGLAKSRIDEYVSKLASELGVEIDKQGPVYTILKWGAVLNPKGVRLYLRSDPARGQTRGDGTGTVKK